jgi:hypothetical protein
MMIQEAKWSDEAGAREALVAWARGQLGVTDPDPYWIEVLGEVPIPPEGKRIHWCGAFVLAGLHAVGICNWPWDIGEGFIRECIGFAARIQIERGIKPQPGDVVYVETAAHHALVSGPPFMHGGDLYIPSIDGNAGPAPGIVSEHKRIFRKSGTHYYPIGPAIRAALVARSAKTIDNEKDPFDDFETLSDPARD